MRALIQRVRNADVTVEGETVGKIGNGLVVFLGVTHSDTSLHAEYLAKRCADLRVFEDEDGKMNLSVRDLRAEILVVSQFTLYADTRKGNRPGFSDAAAPDHAEPRYEEFLGFLRRELGEGKIAAGRFRAMMDVELVNAGPVTLLVESKE